MRSIMRQLVAINSENLKPEVDFHPCNLPFFLGLTLLRIQRPWPMQPDDLILLRSSEGFDLWGLLVELELGLGWE